MRVEFRQVASALYEQFGDQGIEWIQKQADDFFNAEAESASAEDSDKRQSAEADDLPTGGGDEADADTDSASFVDDVEGSVESLAFGAIVSPTGVAEAIMGMVIMAGEVRKFHEAQVTARVGIAAERDVAIAQVKARQELLSEYLERSFDERSQNFTKLFAVIDEALATDNMTALALGLESVVKLATSSPFKDLRTVEETATALGDPAHQWDF